jgi:tetratricopeptide (TPR) repeat protein
MNLARRLSSVSDRSLRRLIRTGLAVLLIGIPAFAVFYYMDQHVDAGASLPDRKLSGAEAAVRKAPQDVNLRLTLAAMYTQTGRNDDAITQYGEILKVQPAHRVALLSRGDLLREKGDLSGAAADYQKLIRPAEKGQFAGADSALGSALFGMAQIDLAQGKPKRAVKGLQVVLAIDSTDADAWNALGAAELKAGAPARAAAAFGKATAFVPSGWAEPYAGMEKAYTALKDTPHARYAAAMVDFASGDLEKAQGELAPLTSGAAALDATVASGLVAETRSDHVAAARWYRRALKLDKTNFLAQSGLYRMGAITATGNQTGH